MIYLLDTNVISELRKLRPHGGVTAWYLSHSEDSYAISTITVFELQAGAEATRRQNSHKADEIEGWIENIHQSIKVIDLSEAAARLAAKLMHSRSPELFEDALIAATASVNNLTVATRNTRDFEHFGIPFLNPFLFPNF